jgi:hypothetical protein
MNTRTEALPGRKEFLLRIVEQFRELAADIGEPFRAEAYPTNGEAVLSIRTEANEELLRITTRFLDDAGAMAHRLVLLWEDCRHETCAEGIPRLIGLGWKDALPDPAAELDNLADHIEPDSVYRMGHTEFVRRQGKCSSSRWCIFTTDPALKTRLPENNLLTRT